jgi:hypothetical protein
MITGMKKTKVAIMAIKEIFRLALKNKWLTINAATPKAIPTP